MIEQFNEWCKKHDIDLRVLSLTLLSTVVLALIVLAVALSV